MGGLLSVKDSNNHTYKHGIKSRDYFYEEILPKIPKEGLKLLDNEHESQQFVEDEQADEKELIQHDDDNKAIGKMRTDNKQNKQEPENNSSNDQSKTTKDSPHATPADVHIHCESVILSKQQTFQVFNTFVKMDKTLDGVINSSEFHRFFGISKRKISERVFGLIDKDHNDGIDFYEFLTGIYDVCTMDLARLCKFLFDIFDIDSKDSLCIEECDALIRMIYNRTKADVEWMAVIEMNCSTEINPNLDDGDWQPSPNRVLTLKQFINIVSKNPKMIQPILEMQAKIRKKLLGEEFWIQKTCIRTQATLEQMKDKQPTRSGPVFFNIMNSFHSSGGKKRNLTSIS